MVRKPAKRVIPRLKKPPFRKTYIREWREHRGLTQTQLADRMTEYFNAHGEDKGYTHASLGRLENGKLGYTQLTLEAAADALGTSVASLLMRAPDGEGDVVWSLWERARPGERKMLEDLAQIALAKSGTRD